MSCFVNLSEERARTGRYQGGIKLIGEAQGAVAGCCGGVTRNEKKTFGNGSAHDDQEGFLVIRGHGEALIGEEKIRLVPGVALIVPAGVSHDMRCDEDCDCLETFWFHSAVKAGSVPQIKTRCYTSIQEKTGRPMASCQLLTAENGCVDDCVAGVTVYEDTEYQESDCHEDQEGFFVLEGTGYAKVDDEEFPISPGTAFMAPAGALHWLRRDENCPYVAALWFHSAL